MCEHCIVGFPTVQLLLLFSIFTQHTLTPKCKKKGKISYLSKNIYELQSVKGGLNDILSFLM